MEESELIRGCIKGKRKHQKLFYLKYSSTMMGICIRYAKNNDDAQDIFQDAFIKVFENLGNYKGGSLEGWVKRIFVNTAINFFHKNKKHYYHDDVMEVNKEQYHFDDILDELSAKEVMQIVNMLPEGYKVVFNLYVVEGYNHKEISELLKISEGTSKSQLSKAKRMIRDSLKSINQNLYNVRQSL